MGWIVSSSNESASVYSLVLCYLSTISALYRRVCRYSVAAELLSWAACACVPLGAAHRVHDSDGSRRFWVEGRW